MITILDAAKYFVHLSYSESRASLTPLKLQKILYFAQGWSFVWDNKPLLQKLLKHGNMVQLILKFIIILKNMVGMKYRKKKRFCMSLM